MAEDIEGMTQRELLLEIRNGLQTLSAQFQSHMVASASEAVVRENLQKSVLKLETAVFGPDGQSGISHDVKELKQHRDAVNRVGWETIKPMLGVIGFGLILVVVFGAVFLYQLSNIVQQIP